MVEIFVPPANYTPQRLVNKINELILKINPSYINPFTYDYSTNKITFTPIFSGEVIDITPLLKAMGFSIIPNPATKDKPIIGNNTVNPDLTGPSGLYIKSDIISISKKHMTAFSYNKLLKNCIIPLTINPLNNTINIPIPFEIFLSKKTIFDTIDIQVVNQEGKIVNLNGGEVQLNLYFISS